MWELYNVEEDWTQSNDLAAEHPEKLAELQRLFLIQAARFNVLPARHPLRRALQPRHRRPPRSCSPAPPRRSTAGMKRLNENAVLTTKNKSHTITAEIDGARRRAPTA